MERYLYFRAQATDGDDDANDDSACFPASSLIGMAPSGDTTLGLFFKPMMRRTPSGNEPDANASFDNHDKISLTIPANTHLIAMKAITKAIVTGKSFTNNNFLPALIIVANNDSGGTEYLEGSGITSCASIVINPPYSN